ncbi:cytochrome c Hsc [Legionella quinlivanii]|uniref:Cytochrome c Hsc n=1 Tax=Legionella quinlivanii TaxID=45073 RepID=A0A0W0XZH8_9GAMM|nr:cytochrome B6 [Legionella quinlivanii]KTD50205.1 cytochrome c Hsc [Legionella quinlivanii]MCW8450050.1 cytochrome B6 [Legionella quinlivanii]SEF47569.1 Cytochrome c peroxidase [Legionella quinlivanii DSM 21216]STY11803.1 cytochrome c Hsc [Legionella quinlivanii]
MRTSAKWLFPLLVGFGTAAYSDHPSSYMPVDIKEDFQSIMKRMVDQKEAVEKKHADLLEQRYDLSNKPATGTTMTGGKPIQEGVRVKLPAGLTWEALAKMTPEEIKEKGVYPLGFLPLPHPNHPEGGMLFPKFVIDEFNKQEQRDLTRFDLDFDIPDHFLPIFPAPIFLTTRPDLGDVSKGKLVNINNYYELFNGLLNPKQLEGLRLLVTPFPQQQFNQTEDRRTVAPSRGVACFDCHSNGHTNKATHLVGDIRPQEFRHRINTPSLRGLNIQRLFGSQRALKTVEDFTEFEQRAAYFDGDPVIATKKGVNILERGSQVHFMAEFQEILDFPPAPKLAIDGKLDPSKATAEELRGQELFFGKAQCSTCHTPPYYTDNTMHNLQTERFFKPVMINNMMAVGDGPIKTFPLRGIKDSPPYLHDGRLLTLDDSVEFFNLILKLQLNDQEKKDLVSFMKAL